MDSVEELLYEDQTNTYHNGTSLIHLAETLSYVLPRVLYGLGFSLALGVATVILFSINLFFNLSDIEAEGFARQFFVLFLMKVIIVSHMETQDVYVWLAWYLFVGFVRAVSSAFRHLAWGILKGSSVVSCNTRNTKTALMAATTVSSASLFLSGTLLPVATLDDGWTFFRWSFDFMVDMLLNAQALHSLKITTDPDLAITVRDGASKRLSARLMTHVIIFILSVVYYSNVLYLTGMQAMFVNICVWIKLRLLMNSLSNVVVTYAVHQQRLENMSTQLQVNPADLEKTKQKIDEGQPCAICRDDFHYLEVSEIVLLDCGHVFHRACILPWLDQHRACPTCFAPIALSPPPPRQNKWDFLLNMLRGGGLTQEEMDRMVMQARLIFPHIDPSVIAADLHATQSLEMTSNNIVEGRLG